MNKIVAILIAAVALVGSAPISEGVWVIDAESRLSIEGSTNVNTFICKIEYCTGTDTLQYTEHNSTRQLRFTRSKMSIPIQSFDCGAKAISKDFWKTLKAEKYPNMKINFIALENLNTSENIKGVVDITLAGSSANYNVCYKATVKPNGSLLLRGVHVVNFADFGLVPPKKMNGLIKVKENLKVEFHLVLKEI